MDAGWYTTGPLIRLASEMTEKKIVNWTILRIQKKIAKEEE